MIGDLKQPAKSWLADAIDICGEKLGAGDDPSFFVEISGVKFEFRLMHLPGHFQRVNIPVKTPGKRKPKH